MRVVEQVLLCQRSDGKFLRLHESAHTTGWEFVSEPELATRREPYFKEQLQSPKPADYYFENSWRARELWVKDCVMVPYEIVTTIEAARLPA